MKMKKLLASVLAAATVLTSGAAVLAVEQPKFNDVPSNAWYADAVSIASKHGMMNGVGGSAFQPSGTMDRAMVAQVLYNRAGKPAVSGKSAFTDVKSGAWYYDAVQWAAQNKVVNGVGGGKFAPTAAVTRQEFAAMLYRSTGSPSVSGSLAFRDAQRVSGWATSAMLWATQSKIVNGSREADGALLLNPTAYATRAESAQMLTNYLQWSESNSLVDLYHDSDVISATGQTQTTAFTTVSGQGNIVRYWYRNDSKLDATVYLQQYDSSSKSYATVETMTVKAGENAWKEYTNESAATYRIRIEAKGGPSIAGSLRVVQAYDALA